MGKKAEAMMAASGVQMTTDEPTIQPLLERGKTLRMTQPLQIIKRHGVKTIKIVKDESKIPENYQTKTMDVRSAELKKGGKETIARKGSDVIVSVGDLLDENNIQDDVKSDDEKLKKFFKSFLAGISESIAALHLLGYIS